MLKHACSGLNCLSTDLIEAHIIPKAFARLIRGPGPNVTLSLSNVREAKPQLGEFDREILCADCDHRLGIFDGYAADVCTRFEQDHTRSGSDIFEFRPFDGTNFAKFVLAVLWRASISKRATFKNVSLGPYETQARDVLFGARTLQSLKSFQVLIQRYTSPHIDMKGVYTVPIRSPFMGLNAYGMMLSGFRILAKLDNRPLATGFAPFVINSATTLRGVFVEFEKTPELDRVKTIAVNHLIRTRDKGLKS